MLGLVAPVLLALLVARAFGGSLQHLATHQWRWWPLALLALGVQIPLYSPPFNTWPPLVGIGTATGLCTTGLILIVLLRNAVRPLQTGLVLMAIGISLNLLVMAANGGWMP